MCDVIRHVFNEWSGVLPFQVFNEFSPTAKCRPKDRKITRLKQIFDVAQRALQRQIPWHLSALP
jgi:hypothetical protein